MNWFKNMKIRTKMLVSFMLVIALTMTLVLIAVTRTNRVSEDYLIAINHPLLLKSSLLEFQAGYFDLRRMVTMALAYSDKGSAKRESLFNDARKAFESSLACLDRAKNTVNTNPRLSRAEKDARTVNNDILRGLFRRYYDEVVMPVMDAERENDNETSLEIIGSTTAIVSAVSEKLDEMLESAMQTADNQIRRTAREVDAAIAILVAVSLGAALVAVAIALYVANFIGKPLVPLTGFMREAADAGIYTFRPEDEKIIGKSAGTKDELGQMITASTAFVGRVADIGSALEKVAGGDLASGFPLLSDRDTIGLALQKMVENLHAMFAEINSSSIMTAMSASQVADGAQGLASGSMQQSAAVEELSVAISEAAEKTKRNTEMAVYAAKLADTIKGDAEKGNRQMEEMMAAVRQIGEASRSISKVMKTIDDIAFQTNILALNAAVEAARAGRQGKGFAVVAEEVRNLAAKSAEAAKDTEAIIADSMERAELGARIAGETSRSLLEIVSGITESNRLVSEIARLAEEQSVNIAQIKTGIDQVAQVAHQNSVTAEESAAAADEMNSQSAALQKLISRFRLQRGTLARERPPQREREAPEPVPGGEDRAGGAERFAGRLLEHF